MPFGKQASALKKNRAPRRRAGEAPQRVSRGLFWERTPFAAREVLCVLISAERALCLLEGENRAQGPGDITAREQTPPPGVRVTGGLSRSGTLCRRGHHPGVATCGHCSEGGPEPRTGGCSLRACSRDTRPSKRPACVRKAISFCSWWEPAWGGARPSQRVVGRGGRGGREAASLTISRAPRDPKTRERSGPFCGEESDPPTPPQPQMH